MPSGRDPVATERFSTLTWETCAGFQQITLSRPELLNRVDKALHDELIRAFRSITEAPDGARALVIASTGRVFSAGGDFDWIQTGNQDIREGIGMMRDAARLITALLDVPVPVIGAMQGDAIGLGATILLGCDAVVAFDNARIADPHVSLGLVAGDGGCVLWPQTVGYMKAKRYLLTGDALPASVACDLGLITDLVATADDVLPTAHGLAKRIAALPPLAVQGTKKALNASLRLRMNEVLELGLTQELLTLQSDDLREALAALREKRPGRYVGR